MNAVKPATFKHFAPTSVQDALALMSEYRATARPLAGGQSLVPMMNFRLAQPAILIDLNRIEELAAIRDLGDSLSIGAMTRERTIEHSEIVVQHAPLLHHATQNIAHLPIRSRGTIGGSIAHADPAAEYPAAVLALDAILVARSQRGERRIPAQHFFTGIMTTALEPDELLVEIVVPKVAANTGAAFVEISRRHGDYALVGIAVQLSLAGDRVADIRLAACGIGAGPIRLKQAERAIGVRGLTEDGPAAAGAAAAAEVEPGRDLQASADYRRRLAGVLTKRGIRLAAERARRAA